MRRGKKVTEATAQKLADAFGKTSKEMFVLDEDAPTGLDPRTVADIRVTVSAIFNTAVRKEILTKNPVANTTPPKYENKTKIFLDDTQCVQLLEILEGHKNPQLRVMLTTLLHSGFRSGELLALRWQDVDFEQNVLHVRHTLSYLKGEYKLTEPKTKGSVRSVNVDAAVIEMLKVHLVWQAERREAVGDLWVERGAVFTGEFGEWYKAGTLNAAFKRLIGKRPQIIPNG